MADLTKYNPLLAWRTFARNVYQLTRADVDNPATYRLTVKVEDTNNVGQGEKDTTCWFTDYMGIPYKIIAVDTNTIDVSDVFRTGYCPTGERQGWVHKSAYKGYSIALPSNLFWNLHPLAVSNNNRFTMSILWQNSPNPLRIPFTATDNPQITGYQSDQTIDGKVYNLSEDYGVNPKVRLIEFIDGIERHRTELFYKTFVNGLIDKIRCCGDEGIGEIITGYIEISN